MKAVRKSYFACRISETQDHQAELFHIVCDLSGTGHSDRPPSSIFCNQFVVFFKQEVEVISWDLGISSISGLSQDIQRIALPGNFNNFGL